MAAAALLLTQAASATTIGRLSFEQMTDTSELIVSGKVTLAWAAWDENHKYIWTHYDLAVRSALKGAPGSTVEFAEPGGTLDGIQISIAGSVVYQPGESVLIFLQRMPNGYLRTTGWSQGRFEVGANNRLHADSILRGLEVVDAGTAAAAATSLHTLDGMSVGELSSRVAARMRATARQGRTN